MPLRKQTISIPIGGGIDTKTDDKKVKPSKLLSLENGEFTTPGEINKRAGTLYQGYNMPTGKGVANQISSIFSRDKELYLVAQQTTSTVVDEVDGWTAYSLNEQTNKFIEAGKIVPMDFTINRCSNSDNYYEDPDVAICNDYMAVVWSRDAPLAADSDSFISIIDTVTGARVVNSASLGTAGEEVFVTSVGNSFHVWCHDANGGIPPAPNIRLKIIPTSTLVIPGAWTNTINNSASLANYDVCETVHSVQGDCSFVAYQDNALHVSVAWVKEDGTVVANIQYNNASYTPCAFCVSCFEAFDHNFASYRLTVVWVCNHGGANDNKIYYYQYNRDQSVYFATPRVVTATTAVTPDVVYNITGCEDPSYDSGTPSNSALRFFIECRGEDPATVPPSGVLNYYYNFVRTAVYSFGGGVQSDEATMWNTCLVSKAFVYGNKARVWTAPFSDEQGTYFLKSSIGNSELATDAKLLNTQGAINSPYGTPRAQRRTHLSKVLDKGSDKHSMVALRRESTTGTTTIGGVDILLTLNSIVEVETEFTAGTLHDTQLGETVQLSRAGYFGDVDGRVTELGFHRYPQISVFENTDLGGHLVDGTYYYKAIYEYADDEGQLHRSAAGSMEAVASTGSNTQTLIIFVPYLHDGDWTKLGKVRIKLYRAYSGVYYLVRDTIYANDVTAAYVAITDSSNIDISANQILYTDGGILENIGPPAAKHSCIYNNRTLLVPQDDPENIWFSKEKAFGIGIEFSDLLTKRVVTGGPIVALGSLDDKAIVFKERQIRAFSGSGPNSLGQSGAFSQDILITSDVGCRDPESIVQTDKGLMFMSDKGIYLLTRGLEVGYIGAPVEAYNSNTVLDARLVASKNQARFLMDNNTWLVYDYLLNQWTTWPATALTIYDATDWDGDYVFWEQTGKIMKEGVNFIDQTALFTVNQYDLVIETAWIKRESLLQGCQRIWWVYILGDYKSIHDLQVEVCYDYIDTVAETFTFDVTAAVGADAPYQFRFMPARQRCQAIKFKISDPVQSPPYESFSLSALELLIGVEPKLARIKPAKEL